MKRFLQMIRGLCGKDHLQVYQIELDCDTVICRNHDAWWESKHPQAAFPAQDTEICQDARSFAVKLLQDVYALEQAWRQWWDDSGRPSLSDP